MKKMVLLLLVGLMVILLFLPFDINIAPESDYSGRFRHGNPIDSATLFRSIAPPHSGAFRHPPVEGRISDAG